MYFFLPHANTHHYGCLDYHCMLYKIKIIGIFKFNQRFHLFNLSKNILMRPRKTNPVICEPKPKILNQQKITMLLQGE